MRFKVTHHRLGLLLASSLPALSLITSNSAPQEMSG